MAAVQPVAPMNMEKGADHRGDQRGNVMDLSKKPNYKTGDVPSDDVCVFAGCGWAQAGFYCSCPDMLGCAHSLAILCFTWEQMTCKVVRKEENTTACCVTNRTNCDLRPSCALLKYRSQAGCVDTRCAIPTGPMDYEYPAICNVFGINCCLNCKCSLHCCKTIGTIRAYG
jgi:hypothetical protein